MKTPDKVKSIEYIASCPGTTLREWNALMANTTKANGSKIRKLIKERFPDLYYDLALNFPNPYEYKSVKKKGLLVYNHSGIEFFFKIKT